MTPAARRTLALAAGWMVLPLNALAQDTSGWSVATGPMVFQRLLADPLEPRLGTVVYTGQNRLRLDIGNSVDLAIWRPRSAPEATTVAVGIDLATHTLLRRDADFHFPVEASDYLFGVNLSGRRTLTGRTALGARLRIAHISAHLVDGRFDKRSGTWRDGQLPRVYSREYVELTGSAARRWGGLGVRLYGGGQGLFHVNPELPKLTGQAGIELTTGDRLGRLLTGYLAHDLKVQGTGAGAVRSAHSTQVGLKLGRFEGRGVQIFATRYTGISQHGEFFDRTDAHGAVGLLFDW